MTIADNVLQKLSGIDNELESVYESAIAIKKLERAILDFQNEIKETFSNQEAGINSLYNTAEKNHKELLETYEGVFGSRQAELNKLKKYFLEELEGLNNQKSQFDLSIRELEQRKKTLDTEIDFVLAKYQEAQNKIGSALSSLAESKLEALALEKKLTQAFMGLDNTIADQLTQYTTALDSKLTPVVTQHLDKLDVEVARFKKDADTKLEINLTDQNEKLNSWISDKEIWFESQQNESRNLIDQIKVVGANLSVKADELTEKLNKDLQGFKDGAALQIKKSQEEITFKIDEAITQLNEKIETKLGLLEQRQTQFLEHQRALVDGLIQRLNLNEKNIPEMKECLASISEETQSVTAENKSLVTALEAIKNDIQAVTAENKALVERVAKLEPKPKTSIFGFKRKSD